MSSPTALPKTFHPAWPCEGCGRLPFVLTSSHKKLFRRLGQKARPAHLKLVHVPSAKDAAWLCPQCRETNRLAA